jgi:excinuclease UvrABC nuclease subunit
MTTKKSKYNKTGIEKLPNNKPAVYKILTATGKPNYVGVAKRGRIQERISEHIGEIPGATVQIQQTESIAEARKKEAGIIKRSNPRYNKQGK